MKSLIRDSVLYVGRVISVHGRTIKVLVSKTKNTSTLLYNGQLLKNVTVGGYIKITKGFDDLVGVIDGEETSEDKNFKGRTYKHKRADIKRVLTVKLLGYYEKKEFKRGVKSLPLIDNECFLLTEDETDQVLNFIKEIDGVPDDKLHIGNLANEHSKKLEVGVNSLFASHIGVFGNTGSGKSYTLASIYFKLFNKYQEREGFQNNTKFLLIDFNGEFSTDKCITEEKKIYNLTTRKRLDQIDRTNKLPLNEKTLVDEELLSILSNATEKTQKPFISRVVGLYNRVQSKAYPNEYFNGILKNYVSDILKMSLKDKAFSLIDFMGEILLADDNVEARSEILRGDLEWHNTLNYFKRSDAAGAGQISQMEIENNTEIYNLANNYTFPENSIKKVIHYFYLQLIIDVYTDKALYEHVGYAIHKLKSKTDDLQKVIDFDSENSNYFEDTNAVVVNLNETNIETRKLIPLLIAKHVYSDHKDGNREDGSSYLNIIVDEAHNILSYNSERESETWKDYRLETFEEIIKEGRKFGVFLTVSSQRPSDISDTIISQLHNYFIHRLINEYDIQKVERTISYLDRVSAESLSILPTGTCIFAGQSAHIPVIIEIDSIIEGYEPLNKTIKPTEYW